MYCILRRDVIIKTEYPKSLKKKNVYPHKGNGFFFMFKYKLKLNVCERESVCFVHVCVCVYTR